MTSKLDTIVIGGGVVGLSIALRLIKDGIETTIIDSLPVGNRASFGNAGIINPDTVMPMAGPGVFGHVAKWALRQPSPLFIKSSYFPKVFPWLLRYVKAGQPKNVRHIATAMYYLHNKCVEDWESLLGSQFMSENMSYRGGLQLWSGLGNVRAAKLSQEIRKQFSISAEFLTPERIRELVPDIDPAINNGLLINKGGFTTDPAQLCEKLASEFINLGGNIIHRTVESIVRTRPKNISIVTNIYPIECSRVIVAAGIWSKDLLSPFGINVPLEAERGYHATFPNHNIKLAHSISFKDRGFSVTPMSGGLRVAGTVEFSGVRSPPTIDRAKKLIAQAHALFPHITHDEPKLWSGIRPSFPDSLPVIGSITEDLDVIMAFGHSHYGMSGASSTARIVSEIVHGICKTEHNYFNHSRF